MQLPSYFRVHLDLVMTQQDLYLLRYSCGFYFQANEPGLDP